MLNEYDIIIIGAGPAGLSAATYAGRGGYKTLILERGIYGGQMQNTGEIENYPAFTHISGPELSEHMYKQAIHFGAEYKYGSVKTILEEGDLKKVILNNGKEFLTKAVIIATGAVPRKAGFAGEKENTGMGVSYCALCDGAFFRNKEIVVVGGGDSAVEESVFLTKFADKVTVLNRSGKFRATKILQDRMEANEKVTYRHWTSVKEVVSEGGRVSKVKCVDNQTGEEFEMKCDGVFVFVGLEPNNEVIDKELVNEGGYVNVDHKMTSSIGGIFFAGDIVEKEIRQVVTAASDGSIAAIQAGHYIESLNK